jgi:hypothetical protein
MFGTLCRELAIDIFHFFAGSLLPASKLENPTATTKERGAIQGVALATTEVQIH